ncbi:dihydropteroate synthase [[Clostridium] leptum]|uniref:Dihydropteroate synthase n=1 Tax=Solibaculum mannosilyticum TaxID=2780922 RepID=A0A7I8D6D1_9FIRM|nr:dihydropteroate synthase [Solibaculum mannosilyticum]MCO7136829.1 dihydropteroate synthase [[Clostridium] leptum]BCI61292.1 dihydropteroate synthase [Solibaculum mannosilyticum]
MYFSAKGFCFDVSDRTLIMGILNITPDSFSDGGRYLDPEKAVGHACRMLQEGADILDIGAQSTRPGCREIGPDEEWERMEPVLRALVKETSCPISIDTFYPEVAKWALDAGAHIINDVSGCAHKGMLETVAAADAAIVIMHPGDASKVDGQVAYPRGVVEEVRDFLHKAALRARGYGLPAHAICLDPGIGFGKTMAENLALVKAGPTVEGYPWLVGASRKRVTSAFSADASADRRLGGTIAVHTAAQLSGAHILRVHDVFEGVQAARTIDALLGKGR